MATTAQGVGALLASRRGQDWEKLVAWAHDAGGGGSSGGGGGGGDLGWAVNAISGAVSAAS